MVDATEEDGETFFGRETYAYPTLGFTSRIRDHEGPDLDYGAEESDGSWTVTPTVTETSDEGTNDSWALEQGTHRVPDTTVDDKPLYVEVSAEKAAQIKAAENEHVADYRYAKDLVLDPGDAWLAARLDDRQYGPAASKEDAEALADADLDTGLRTHLGLTGVNAEFFSWANLAAYYARASTQTEKRDTAGWHSFDKDRVVEAERVVDKITTGSVEIGSHDSASVVKADEVS